VTAGTARPARLPQGSAVPLNEAYDAALLDLDGVIYIGPAVVDNATEALAEARRRGMRLAFVTNNASRPPQAVADHLCQLGIPASREEVATSAQAAARLIGELVPAGAAVLVVGGPGLEEALLEHGLRPVRSIDEGPAAVVQGWHPSVGWEQLAQGAYAVQRGLPWVASNMDITFPTPRGLAPGNGSLVAVVQAASGGSPLVAGKPELPLHQEAIERTRAQRPLVVGDRLDTDIEGAVTAATDSLLVLTGVTPPALLLAAGPSLRPTYLAPDLRGLLTPHPFVTSAPDGGWICRGWRASVRGGRLLVEGAGDPYDGLRAACAACWEARSGAGPGGGPGGPGAGPPGGPGTEAGEGPIDTAAGLRALGW
jgi:glycerol-1-phosphatase